MFEKMRENKRVNELKRYYKEKGANAGITGSEYKGYCSWVDNNLGMLEEGTLINTVLSVINSYTNDGSTVTVKRMISAGYDEELNQIWYLFGLFSPYLDDLKSDYEYWKHKID